MSSVTKATIEDLYREKGKAEIVDGEIIRFMPTGAMPSRAGSLIYVSLFLHEQSVGGGHAFADNTGFVVNLPHRDSFSPDVSWYIGDIRSMRFLEGAPVFAVEVRSENDYGAKAEREMEQKRRDYFAAGTLVVWDVDLLGDEVIKAYRRDDPDHPVIYRRGEYADAETAVPGWAFPVDSLFT